MTTVQFSAGSDLVLDSSEHGSATFSRDRLYRYRLTRRWKPGGLTAVWFMLNPSKAGAVTNDATIRRCIGFSDRRGAGSLVVVNLFARISTVPDDLLSVEDPVGAHNDRFISEAFLGATPSIGFVAWGGVPNKLRKLVEPRIEKIRSTFGKLRCLGRTAAGDPRHPVRLPYAVNMEEWS